MLITQHELSQNQANNTQYLEQARIAAIKIIVAYVLQLDHNTNCLQAKVVEVDNTPEDPKIELKIDLNSEVIDRADFEDSLQTVLSYIDQMDNPHKARAEEQPNQEINPNTATRLDALGVNISQEYLNTPVDRALFNKALCFLKQIKHLKGVADIIGPLDDFEESHLSPVEIHARENAIFQQISNLAGASSYKGLTHAANITGYLYMPILIILIVSAIFVRMPILKQ